MSKTNHHYVPQFYLRLFGSDVNSSGHKKSRRIHLYNLAREKSFHSVSLTDQCYRRHFHGKGEEIENALAEIESRIAPTIQQIVLNSKLPRSDSQAHEDILTFVAYQMIRTPHEIKRLSDKTSLILKESEKFSNGKIERVQKNHIFMVLKKAPLLISQIRDLKIALLYSNSIPFITSDHPVYKYNQLYEHIHETSFRGTGVVGIQIVIPLSPHHSLLLYDGAIYRINKNSQSSANQIDYINLTSTDVSNLNACQIVNAETNLYFSEEAYGSQIGELIRSWKDVRQDNVARVRTHGKYKLVHDVPDLIKLELSCLSLNKLGLRILRQENLKEKNLFRTGKVDMTRPEVRHVVHDMKRLWKSHRINNLPL